MLLPSEREGYGLIVVEAVSLGTPAVVVAGPDNAATELVEPGVNGVVADSIDPEVVGAAILEVTRRRRSAAGVDARLVPGSRSRTVDRRLAAPDRGHADRGR